MKFKEASALWGCTSTWLAHESDCLLKFDPLKLASLNLLPLLYLALILTLSLSMTDIARR